MQCAAWRQPGQPIDLTWCTECHAIWLFQPAAWPLHLLQGRTEKRQIGGRAGNTFSVATFALGGSEVGGLWKGRLLPGLWKGAVVACSRQQLRDSGAWPIAAESSTLLRVQDGSGGGGDDPSYWATLLPGAAADYSAQKKRVGGCWSQLDAHMLPLRGWAAGGLAVCPCGMVGYLQRLNTLAASRGMQGLPP